MRGSQRPRTPLKLRVPAEPLQTHPSQTHQTPPRLCCLYTPPYPSSRSGDQPGMVGVPSERKQKKKGGGCEGSRNLLPPNGGSRQAAGARGPEDAFGVRNVTVAAPVRTSHGRLGYSPSSLSNTIVLRNEESFPGRSVLGSRRLDRSLWLRASPGNGFETRG